MTTHTTSADGAVDASVLALHSALRRRGLAPTDGDQTGEVRVEHRGRRIDVCFQDGEWRRPIPGTERLAVVSREGAEEFLGRWIANELLGQL
jgi:hypothetical protein